MANSTKRQIILQRRREEREAMRAIRFVPKPRTIRQTKRTIAIVIFGSSLVLVMTLLRFTVLEPAFEPFRVDEGPVRPKPTPAASIVGKPLSIEELEHQALLNNPRTDQPSH